MQDEGMNFKERERERDGCGYDREKEVHRER